MRVACMLCTSVCKLRSFIDGREDSWLPSYVAVPHVSAFDSQLVTKV